MTLFSSSTVTMPQSLHICLLLPSSTRFPPTHFLPHSRIIRILTTQPQENLFIGRSFAPLLRIADSFRITTRTSQRTVRRRFEDEQQVSAMPSEEHAEVERPPFDLNLAVVLAGFAFESYNTPPAKVGVHEVDAFDCETVFLSQHFLREFYDGQLFIQLKRGSQFPGLDLWGTSDPYVTLRTGDCVVRSRTIWATTEPVWDESFAINMKNPSSQYLQIAAWDANIVAYDRRLGNASVALEPLSDGKKHEVCMELEGMGGGGVLYLEVQYKTFSQIDEEKKDWKIPLLSDFFMGEGLENFLMDAFGSEGIKARDFVWSAIGNLQLSLDDGKAETQNSHGCSQTMESRSTISEETLESNDGRTRTKKEGDFKVEVGQNGKESRIPKVEITPLPEKDTKERSSVGALETDKQISETELEESLERQVDFLRILGKGVDSILGAGTVESLKIPSIDHVSWDAIDMIKRLGLESQTRADTDYVENGLALPKAQQDIYPTPESSPGLRSVPSTEELKKVSVDVLKQMEEVLGSWAVVAASVTGKGKEIKQGMGEDMKGKTVAIVKEQQPESFKNWEDEFTRKTVETTTANSDEMEELRKMFETAESAMEAWAMLATSLGRTSFVKSEFEKICFLDNNKTDTQVAIWRDDRQHRLVVAFRGTEQVKWKDLRTDLMLLPTGFNPERVGGDFKEEVMVHSGFLSAYDSVRNRLLSFVKTSVGFSESEQETRPKWHIYVTGHSLGGALATLFALELSSTKLSKCGDVKVTMYNFGSPRVGNKRFAEQYNEKVKDSWRVVNHRDIIPTVPRLMGYCHVAQPIYLAAGDIMSATVNMELLEDGYEGDVIGEATPDFLLEEFMKGEKKLIDRLLQTEIAMLRALRDGSALMQHMEDFYYIALLERVSPMLRLTESDPKQA